MSARFTPHNANDKTATSRAVCTVTNGCRASIILCTVSTDNDFFFLLLGCFGIIPVNGLLGISITPASSSLYLSFALLKICANLAILRLSAPFGILTRLERETPPFLKENAFPDIQRTNSPSNGFVISLMSISLRPRNSAKVFRAVMYWHLPPAPFDSTISSANTKKSRRKLCNPSAHFIRSTTQSTSFPASCASVIPSTADIIRDATLFAESSTDWDLMRSPLVRSPDRQTMEVGTRLTFPLK